MGRAVGWGKYPVRYTHPITGVISSTSRYVNKQGRKKKINTKYIEYKVGDKWLKSHLAPHNRESKRKNLNTKKGFFLQILSSLGDHVRRREKKGKYIQGKHEFIDNRRGRCDRLMAHFDKQVERYGDKCPITHIPFTMNTLFERFDINNRMKTFSNVSPDRIFNYINYTEQNLIFTSQLWNLTKGENSLYELGLIFKPEIIERYKAIVIERFPDQKYALQT
jgi:hypothetical protein